MGRSPQALYLFLKSQLLSLQGQDGEVVDGRMQKGVFDLPLQFLVFFGELLNMRL